MPAVSSEMPAPILFWSDWQSSPYVERAPAYALQNDAWVNREPGFSDIELVHWQGKSAYSRLSVYSYNVTGIG